MMKMMIFQWMKCKFEGNGRGRGRIVSSRKNSEAFDKETRNENIDITDVDASADLFGK